MRGAATRREKIMRAQQAFGRRFLILMILLTTAVTLSGQPVALSNPSDESAMSPAEAMANGKPTV